jgi:RNA polymerase sigma factor (sigma-70 family)
MSRDEARKALVDAGRELRPSSDSYADAEVVSLVEAARMGDAIAWGRLVTRFGGMVWHIAHAHGLGGVDAADVSQVTWMRLLENFDRIEQPEKVGAWLATTARRESMRVASNSRRQIPVADDSVFDVADVYATTGGERLLVAERDAQLRAAYEQLPIRCKLMLSMLYRDASLSYRDIAEILDIPIGSIGSARQRCLKHLRRLMGEP